MVAKVILPNGNIFFVPPGREIHQESGYEGLPLEDKKALCFMNIWGEDNGFSKRFDQIADDDKVTQELTKFTTECSPLILPKGTRIEPEPEHPSLREK